MDTLTLYGLVLLALSVVLVAQTGYLMGSSRNTRRELRRAREETIPQQLTRDEPSDATLIDSNLVTFDVVDLPATTAPHAIVEPASLAARREVEQHAKLQSITEERDALLLEIERLKAELAHKEALRVRYLRQARAQTERVNFMLRLFSEARRRPTKADLSTVMIDLPRGRQVALVPPSIANEWSELS